MQNRRRIKVIRGGFLRLSGKGPHLFWMENHNHALHKPSKNLQTVLEGVWNSVNPVLSFPPD